MSSTIEYEIRPQLEFGRGFRLFRSGTLLSEVREQTRDDFRIEVGTARHRILTQSQFGVRHELVRGSDEVLAVAERPVTVSPRYEVRLPTGQPIQITPVATYGLKCHVERDDAIIGLVDPDRLGTRDATASLPEVLGVAVSTFIVWIVLVARHRH